MEKRSSAKHQMVNKEGGQKVTGRNLCMNGKSKGNIFTFSLCQQQQKSIRIFMMSVQKKRITNTKLYEKLNQCNYILEYLKTKSYID